jgi:hypothetical protein
LESGEKLRVTNVLWVPELRRSVVLVLEIENKGYHILFQDGQVLFVPRGSSFISVMVFGVRGSNLYRLNGHPIQTIAKNSRVTVDREQRAPLAMQVQREQMAPVVVQTQRELDFIGIQPSGFSGEGKPPKIVRRKSNVRGSMQTQREPDLKGSQWAQRERVNHSEGVHPHVQVGERHLPRLIGRCHGSRRQDMRLLGAACIPRRIHAFQQVLFQ